eukprot:GHVU01170671.1.p1 GENE.GHVU01170671.1~~GHVU01170671.1.p1  ORF type:complete len:149 (-),score=26.91 GHVU01170671.1:307-753(-)
MLFPAAKIAEGRLFHSPTENWSNDAITALSDPLTVAVYEQRHATRRKWAKNGIRTILVGGALLLSDYGLLQLDNFVTLIGAFCCVPLAFVYPALFHLRLRAETPAARVTDVTAILLGASVMGFSAAKAVATWHVTDVGTRCDTWSPSS